MFFLCEVYYLVVRITEGAENAENTEGFSMHLYFFLGEIVMKRKRFRVLCVLRAFRDSDRKEIRVTELIN